MNQLTIGKFIAQKRRELNLTQEQLGEKLGVSHKSISKWETGKCMPDYSIIEPLCQALGITISELLDGEENEKENIRTYDDSIILTLLEREQRMQTQMQMLIGIMLAVIGIALASFNGPIDGPCFQNFFHGIISGMSIVISLIGVFVIMRSISKWAK